jgi:hypothetical protein
VARALTLTSVVVAAGEACVVSPTASTFSSQDSCPPTFAPDDSSTSTNYIVALDPSKVDAFNASVPLRSCATTKDFVGRTFVDRQPFFVHEDSFLASGGDTRVATIGIPVASTALSNEGCHLVELYASSAFAVGDLRTPATPGDLAYISWFVYTHTAGAPEVKNKITDCPTTVAKP